MQVGTPLDVSKNSPFSASKNYTLPEAWKMSPLPLLLRILATGDGWNCLSKSASNKKRAVGDNGVLEGSLFISIQWAETRRERSEAGGNCSNGPLCMTTSAHNNHSPLSSFSQKAGYSVTCNSQLDLMKILPNYDIEKAWNRLNKNNNSLVYVTCNIPHSYTPEQTLE